MSIGLTGHYTAINERFPAATLGIGGENLVVEAPALRLPSIDQGSRFGGRTGPQSTCSSPVLPPRAWSSPRTCSARKSLLPRDEITEDLDFLSEGTRGHIVDVDHLTSPVLVEVGDEVGLR